MIEIKQIVIIGAGAAGLMAARELGKAGKNVIVLEARDRVGGRIMPLNKQQFGYPAQGGAEFVHGPAPVTRALLKKAGLTYIPVTDGDFWNWTDGKLTKGYQSIPYQDLLRQRLHNLSKDVPIKLFLDQEFPESKYDPLRTYIFRMVEGYDAADPDKISTFALMEDWLGESHEWLQGRVAEGYGAMLDFLFDECKAVGVTFFFNCEVQQIDLEGHGVQLQCTNGASYTGQRVIVTIPIPQIATLTFHPDQPQIRDAAAQIGYGYAIKILLKFKTRWWDQLQTKDLQKLQFMRTLDTIQTWWTQYPDSVSLLTGYIAGPPALKVSAKSERDILNLALASLTKIFGIEDGELRSELSESVVINWVKDPFAKGSYSYSTPRTGEAYKILTKSIDDKVYFAGEALAGESMAIVEGALKSGQEVAKLL